jgi:glycosyltransferase involved in cell wall biosynthesis
MILASQEMTSPIDREHGTSRAPEEPPLPATRRALFIVITDHPGGAERVAYSLARELSQRPGWNVEVKIAAARLPDSFSGRALPGGVRVSGGPARNWYLSFCWLPFRIAFRRYDLVFTTHVYTNALLSLMRRLRLVRIGTLVGRESTSVFERWSGAKSWRFRQLYRAYGREDLLIAQTGDMAERIRSRLPSVSAAHLELMPNPVDLEAIGRGIASGLGDPLRASLAEGPSILFCGRLIAVKQPSLALAAFHRLVRKGSPARLVFLGDGPLRDELRAEARALGLEERVLFLGNITNPFPVMAACRHGLVTSSREGFPNVILEMMACRVRSIVTTPCAGDLDRLPGVKVTGGFAADEIAAALEEAMSEDWRSAYRAFLASRSTADFVDRLLAVSGAKPKAGRAMSNRPRTG